MNGSLVNGSATLNGSAPTVMYPSVERHIWFAVSFGVCAVGTIAFVAAIVVILLRRSSREDGVGYLILHQLVIEALLLSILYPITNIVSWRSLYGQGTFGIDCASLHFFILYLGCANYWSLFTVACNRYIALYLPHRFTEFSSKTAVFIMSIVTHMIAISTNLPGVIPGTGLVFGRQPWGSCGVTRFPAAQWAELRNALNYYVPIGGTGLLYIVIMLRFRYCSGVVPEVLVRSRKKRYRLTLFFFASYICWFVCYITLPLMSSFGRGLYLKDPNVALWLRFVWLVGCAMNPIILLWSKTDYRETLRRIRQKIFSGSSGIVVAPSDENSP